jgi:uncharacterized membrane protein YfcA
MDGTSLALYLAATFFGGMITGLAGFALGLVVSGVWLHILTPVQTAILICGYGLVSQGMGIWRLRRALDWRALAPYVIGGAPAVPIGALLLAYVDPGHLRAGVGVLLLLYSAYGLARPKLKPVEGDDATNVTIGFLNGLLGGLTGLGGIVVTIWCQLHDWPRDRQRAIFQPVLFAVLVMSAVSLSSVGGFTRDTVELYVLGLPVMLAGTWTGLKLYGRLNDQLFRRIVLVLLLVAGVALLAPEVLR